MSTEETITLQDTPVEEKLQEKTIQETIQEVHPQKETIVNVSSGQEASNTSLTQPGRKEYKKVGFVINPVAGKGRVLKSFQSQVLPVIKQKFKCEICCYLTQSKGDGVRLAKKFVENGFDIIVSVGGDGTNHEVVNGLMSSDLSGKDVCLGIFPLGSGCDFARTIGLDVDNVTKTLNTIFECWTIPCDIGLCECVDFNGNAKKEYFLNISSFGASGQIMKNVNASPMIINHEVTYMFHTLSTSLFTPNSDISLDGKRFKTYITSICNGQFYGNNLWVNPHGNLNDGLLDVIVMEDLSFREVLDAVGKIKTGDHLIVPKVYQDKSRPEVEAHTNQKEDIVIECDGELTGILPAKWKIVKTPFKLIVPKEFSYKKK